MKKGEVWIINIGKTEGHEQEGIRPAVVVADVVGPVATIIPCTANMEALRFPFTIQIFSDLKNKLGFDSVALVFQLRAIDKNKLRQKIGVFSSSDLKKIDLQMKKMLGL